MNYKIVIDASHGGDDVGNSGNGILEKDLMLQISKYMKDRFESMGVPVIMTRETDETITPEQRIEKIINTYGDNSDVIILSNHVASGGGDGAEVIYALRNSSTLSNLILQEIENIGEKTNLPYQRRLPSNTIKDYYFIHRDTGQYTQPVMIIYGSVNNSDEAAKLKSNALEYAEAVVKAVMQYIGKPYIPQNGVGSNIYIVQDGDTLYQIANRYNTTVAELKRLNQLTSDILQIGQVIKVPNIEEEQNDTLYTVKSGDSLWNIARKFNITVDELKRKNNLTNNLLQIGQILKI